MSIAGSFSEDEKSIVECITFNRNNLSTFVGNFYYSVALFELLERGGNPSAGVSGGVFINYRMIAARDGALNIFHFGKTLEAIKLCVPRCPPSALIVNTENVDCAIQQFKECFPNIDYIRHAIAHAGELNNAPTKLKASTTRKSRQAHGISVGPGGIFSHGLFEKSYHVSRSGKIFTVTIDQATLDKLVAIGKLVTNAIPIAQQSV
jgi:hypothetical protein